MTDVSIITIIIIFILYIILHEYLTNATDFLRNKYSNHDLVFLGDFNDSEVCNQLSSHSLRQVVKQPSMAVPQFLPLIGSGDHNIV